jgi:hypothetical protein
MTAEPLTPPDPPQRPEAWHEYGPPAEPVRVDPPEGAPACPMRLPGCPHPARVEPPSGVQVIGWTEPTDDEPRSLPIVRLRSELAAEKARTATLEAIHAAAESYAAECETPAPDLNERSRARARLFALLAEARTEVPR